MRRHGLMLLACLAAAFAGRAEAQSTMTLRDQLVIVSSGSAADISALLARTFAQRTPDTRAPHLHVVGSSDALELFCAGAGPQTPDIAIVSRRMPPAIEEHCAANGVEEVVEQQLGLGAVVLAVRRGDPTPNLTAQQVWQALAAEVAPGDDFVPNRARHWADIAANLPRTEIRMILPNDSSGTRALFNDLVLEAGCRHVKAVRLIFEARYRRSKCVTLHEDGHIVSTSSVDIPATLISAPPGAVAVMSYGQLLASGGNFVALALDGVLPTSASIGSLDYAQTRTLYIYAKRQHGAGRPGIGVVRGIQEFLAEAASEPASGPGGYLAMAGLVALSPTERAAQRRVAERLTLMSR